MKSIYMTSDIHCDFFYPENLSLYDVPYEEFAPILEDWYVKNDLPKTDAILIAGDFANDFLKFTQFIKFISTKYKEVYIVFGNHDLGIRGGTPSESNHMFRYSLEKVEAMKNFIKRDFTNVFILDGDVVNGIGGTMGMCDFTYCPVPGMHYPLYWHYHWYDGKRWKYNNNDPMSIWKVEAEKLEKVIAQQPKIVMTHFLPIEAGCERCYENDPASCFFYFTGKPFLEKMPNDSYWLCGHSHKARKLDYVCENGNVVHIVCNPFGYSVRNGVMPAENTYIDTDLGKHSFVIDL